MDNPQHCTRCSLCYNRTYVVMGDGNEKSGVFILGNKPSHSDDKKGIPYNPRSRVGKFLIEEFGKVGMVRKSDFYITTLIKCKPERDTVITDKEISSCRPFLTGEFLQCAPKVMLLMGAEAVKATFGKDIAIKKLRGHVIKLKSVDVICTYNPSAAMKDKSGEMLTAFRQDLDFLSRYIIKYLDPYLKMK